MTDKVVRKFPVSRDRVDTRDFKLDAGGAGVTLPSAWDLSHFLGPVKDQGDGNTCTAFSWSSVREFLYRSHYLWEHDREVAPRDLILSPQFIYYQERLIEGDLSQNQGADSRTGAKVLSRYGVCLNKFDPYHPTAWEQPPTTSERFDASEYRAGSYHSIPDLSTLKAVIYSGYVASIGFAVYASFQSDEVAATGNIPIPGPEDQYQGGHEVTPYGYDDNHVNWDGSTGAIQFLNSWGIDWGAKVGPTREEPGGSGWMPYGYFNPDLQLVLNMWTQRLP